MFCKNCGAQNLDLAKFCKSCGENLLQAQNKVPQVKPKKIVPQEIKRWNGGAFVFGWIWFVGHKRWLAALASIGVTLGVLLGSYALSGMFFSLIGIVFKDIVWLWIIQVGFSLAVFMALFIWKSVKIGRIANEIAWKSGRFSDVQKFLKQERKWRNWAIGLPIFSLLFVALTIGGLHWFALYQESHYAPVKTSFVKIYDGFGIGADGSLWAWGNNDNGELGDGTTTNRKTPKQIITSGVKEVVKTCYSGCSVFAIKTDGSLWGWGNNSGSLLGNGSSGDKNNSLIPKQIISSGVKQIEVYSTYFGYPGGRAFVVKMDGSLWGWGDNSNGELGDETTTAHSYTPKQIIAKDVSVVKISGDNNFILKTDGSLWGWGKNNGLLGDGTKKIVYTPKKIIDGGVKKIVSGGNAIFVIKADGSLWGWGENKYGQLGEVSDTSKPTQIIANGVKDAMGGDTVFAIKTDGSLWAWGYNSSGQLGDGTKANTSTPKQIIENGVTNMALNYSSTFAIKTDGSLWAWGKSDYVGLGDGTMQENLIPKQIILNGVIDIKLGGGAMFALKKDGSLWSWGYNGSGSSWLYWPWGGGGHLGDGTAINRNTPKQITTGGGPDLSSAVLSEQSITTPPVEKTSVDDFLCGTSKVKDGDDNGYDTIQIGDRCWMASNLKVGKRIDAKKNQTDNEKIEKWCPDDVTDNCKETGGFYTWDEAMQYSTTEGAQGICPSGWHIPTVSEKDTLENHFADAGMDLVFAGFCFNGKFQGQGSSVNFWSSTQAGADHAKDVLVYSDKSAILGDSSVKKNGFSIRCVRDGGAPIASNDSDGTNPYPGYELGKNTGSYDENVKEVQIRINSISGGSLETDGYFGPITRKAVEEFQNDKNIAVTGLVDEVTWNKIFN